MPTGPGEILDLIRHGLAVTRGDVTEQTGLSRMTVAQRIDRLLSERLVVEAGETVPTGGRRRRVLAFNAERSFVVVAAVETTHTRVALTDLAGRVRVVDSVDVPVTEGPSSTLDKIGELMESLVRKEGLADRLGGVGLSVPGPVDPLSGRPSQPPIMPGWDAYPIVEHLQGTFPEVPVLTANDADAAAMGEYDAAYPGTSALCLVKVSTGIGTGIVIGGRSYVGVDGGAGDIGHVRLARHDGEVCQCGAVGCLAAVASGRAVARRLADLGHDARSGRDVGRLLALGDPDAASLTQEAGRRIGEVMATVVCVLNPEVVVIGGSLASAPLLAGVREALYRLSLPRATRHISLHLGTLGEDAAIRGLTRLVVDQEFSPAAVNARLLA